MPDTQGFATGSLEIDAPVQRVYAIIADYREHHPRVLPPEYFKALQVEWGGIGEGTVINVTMRVMGTTQTFQHVVSEPEPGRVLVERDSNGYGSTTFTVEPGASGRSSVLTIRTEFTPRKKGLLGRVERWLTQRVLERIYEKELALIAEYAKQQEMGNLATMSGDPQIERSR